jgi:hypothetical protein
LAIVKSFKVDEAAKGSLHPTEVNARVKVINGIDRLPILQIDTFGSAGREMPGKLSQTLQLTPEAAAELFGIIKRVYRY